MLAEALRRGVDQVVALGAGFDSRAYRIRLIERARVFEVEAGRPFQHLTQQIKMETLARELAERDGIQDGLVGIDSVLEPCRTYSLRWNQPDHL